MDPNTMPAGPEIDVLVAEKVMGWKRGDAALTSRKGGRWFDADGQELDENHATPEGHGDGDYYYPDEAWSPSTDIRAAMEVTEKVGDMMLRKNARRDTSGATDWACYFELERNRRYEAGISYSMLTSWHHADTAPLAICRAALAAVAPHGSFGDVPEDWGHEDCSVCDAARRAKEA